MLKIQFASPAQTLKFWKIDALSRDYNKQLYAQKLETLASKRECFARSSRLLFETELVVSKTGLRWF